MAPDLNTECKVNVISVKQTCGESTVRKTGISGVKSVIEGSVEKVWKLGKEDPRRVIHSVKVGVALSVVSLFYLMDPLFSGVGDNAIWAVMTVVVVLEFTAGATLSKGLNRGIGTLVAGFLATSLSYLSELAGEPGEAILIGFTVFFLGAAASFSRFFPTIRKKYDYGVLVFLLTFNLITVSSYRVDNIFRMAYQRLSTIALGCGVCLVTSLILYPIWAGEDLHKITAEKFETISKYLEECVHEYFDGDHDHEDQDEKEQSASEDQIYEAYKSVLDSKNSDESLAMFASWEPRHGRFRHRHPWNQYVKVVAKLRHLVYSIAALHGCLQSEIQTPHAFRSVLKKPCIKVGEEAAEILRQLSDSIIKMRKCDTDSMMEQLQLAVSDLHAAFRAQPRLFMDSKKWLIEHSIANHKSEIDEPSVDEVRDEALGCCVANRKGEQKLCRRLVSLREHQEENENGRITHRQSSAIRKHGQSVEYGEALPLATFAWMLVEVVARLEHVVEAVDELARKANFKPCEASCPQNPSNKFKSIDSPATPSKTRGCVLESHAATQSVE